MRINTVLPRIKLKSDMSATSDDNTNVGPHNVPTLNVQEVADSNQNVTAISSTRSSAQIERKSGIITEGDSESRQRSGRSRLSSGESEVTWFC